VQFTGRYDANGEPIVRAQPERFPPGTVFTPTDITERDYLLSLDAARPLTPDELTLYESGIQTEFPPSIDEVQQITRTTD
jgi:hypothetical protein